MVVEDQLNERTNDGGYTKTRLQEHTSFFELTPLQGEDLRAAQTVHAKINHKATTHYNGNLTARQQLRRLPDNQIFRIRYVIHPGDDNRVTVVFCEQTVAA